MTLKPSVGRREPCPNLLVRGDCLLGMDRAVLVRTYRKERRFVEQPGMSEWKQGGLKIHQPAEIAERAGGITIKTLSALIRSRGLETTTLGYAPPSRKGGPPRRIWGMTDSQLESLLAIRRNSGNGSVRT